MMSRRTALASTRDSYVRGLIDVEDFERRVEEILADDWHPMKAVDDIMREFYTGHDPRGYDVRLELLGSATMAADEKATSE
jgi:hypothetical protein